MRPVEPRRKMCGRALELVVVDVIVVKYQIVVWMLKEVLAALKAIDFRSRIVLASDSTTCCWLILLVACEEEI